MSDSINVTIISHSSTGLNELEEVLQIEDDIEVTRKLLPKGVVDPFEDMPLVANVLVLELGENWRDVLNAVSSRVRRNRIPMILIGPDGNTEMMRAALKAGARDYQTRPVNGSELRLSAHQLANEVQYSDPLGNDSKLVVFMSAKGGAGASAIAASMAHELAQRSEDPSVLLMDLDLQYGNLPLYLDVSPNNVLTQALSAGERIDSTLLDTCIIKTPDGVDVLSSFSEQAFSAWDISQTAVTNLLNLVCDRYDHVLVDIPRQIDPITFQAIERAACVNIVMQQTLSDLRYARQILNVLKDQGLPNDRVQIIVNRYEKRHVLKVMDVSDAFDGVRVTSLPNDYKRMSNATGNAEPLARKHRSAALSQSIRELTEELFPDQTPVKRGWFGRKKR